MSYFYQFKTAKHIYCFEITNILKFYYLFQKTFIEMFHQDFVYWFTMKTRMNY